MTLRDIQMVSLDIMKDIHNFCVKNKIRYSLQGGSLIGCVRHKGFIPWDDDLDIVMPRPDYDKFIHTYSSENGYKILSRELEGQTDVYLAFGRVCDLNATYVDTSYSRWTDRKHGVWVDVFPVDSVEDSREKALKRIKKLKVYFSLARAKRLSSCPLSWYINWRDKLKLFLKKIIAPFVSYSIVDKHIEYMKSLGWEDTQYYGQLGFAGYGIRDCHNKRVFSDIVLAPFEDASFYIMKGYDEALTEKFGDYMKLPPIEQRTPAHSFYKFYWKD